MNRFQFRWRDKPKFRPVKRADEGNHHEVFRDEHTHSGMLQIAFSEPRSYRPLLSDEVWGSPRPASGEGSRGEGLTTVDTRSELFLMFAATGSGHVTNSESITR